MKKQVFIPQRHKFPVVRKAKATQTTEQKKPLVEVAKDYGIDMVKMATRINICFQLADLMDGLITDAESELKKADGDLGLELRHPIQRIKVHCSQMVHFVDKVSSPEFSESFGDKSDELKELLMKFYEVEL